MNTRDSISAGFANGIFAGLIATSIGVAARFSIGAPTLFDLAENAITRAMPPAMFAFLLDRLQFNAKPLLFLGLVLLQVLAGGVLGVIFASWLDRRPGVASHPIGSGLAFGTFLWILSEAVGLPLLGQGFFGAAFPAGSVAVSLTLALAWIVFGVALGAQSGRQLAAPVNPARRRLVGGLAAAAVTLAVTTVFLRTRQSTATSEPLSDESLTLGPTRESVPYPPRVATWPTPGLAPALTPTPRFYAVTKNLFGDPQIKAADWHLQVGGLVERSLRLGYADIIRLPAVEFYQTLECISNQVGGELISTAWWRGVRLADLLGVAGPGPATVKVVFRAADGYADSLPLAFAVRPDVTLAYQINGQPLPPAHGYPLRLLVPAKYGLKSVKWITQIELVREDFEGYWQERGWSDTARIHTMARIDTPADGAKVSAGPLEIGGVAFAGDRGIKRVQVTLDSGQSWLDAELESPLGPITWTRWRLKAEVSPSTRSISVQATDGTGKVQWPLPQDTVPDGATGTDLHVIAVSPRRG